MQFYPSISNDIPKFNNTYGDFNKLICYIVNGGNNFKVTKIEPHSSNKVKIYWDISTTPSPFVACQTIQVSGSKYDYYNLKYYIEVANTSDGYYIAYNSTLVGINYNIDDGGSANMKSAPCGMTLKYGGVDAKRCVIKTKDGIEFRIDDRDFGPLLSPAVTTDDRWIKVARVSMAESYDSLDFTSSRIAPYNSDRPNENFTPSGNYIGQSLIAYNLGWTNKYYITSTDATANPAFRIWANENFIYIQMSVTSYYSDRNSRSYMFGSINAYNKSKPNGILSTRRCPDTYNNTSYQYYNNELWCNTSWSYAPAQFTHPFAQGIWDTMWQTMVYNNGEDIETGVYYRGSFSVGSEPPSSYNTSLTFPNIINGDIVFSDVLVRNDNRLFGTLYDFKWLNTQYDLPKDKTILIDGTLYMCLRNENSDSSTQENFRKFRALVKMDRP